MWFISFVVFHTNKHNGAGVQLPTASGAGLPGDLDGTVPVPRLEQQARSGGNQRRCRKLLNMQRHRTVYTRGLEQNYSQK